MPVWTITGTVFRYSKGKILHGKVLWTFTEPGSLFNMHYCTTIMPSSLVTTGSEYS
jgi:hypothetical protein